MPSRVTFLVDNCLTATELTPISDIMSVLILYIRLAWVLFGTVLSIGKTSERI